MFSGVTEQLAPLREQLLRPLRTGRVAVGIEADAVTLLAYQTVGGQLQLQSWQQAPLPSGVVDAGVPVLTEALGDLIGDLLLQGGIQAPGARALLPPEAVVLRSLKLPVGRQPDAEIVPWLMGQEAALALPFPLQEAAMSWQQRGDHWLLACLPNDQLDRWIDTFAIAGLDLHGLEPSVLAVERLLPAALQQQAPEQWSGSLDVRGESWQLLLWRGAVPLRQLSLEPSSGLDELQAVIAELDGQPPTLWVLAEPELSPPLESWSQQLGCRLERIDGLSQAAVSDAGTWMSPAPAAVDRLIGLALGGLPR